MLLIYFYLFIFSAVHAYYGFRPPEKKAWYGLLLILFLFILIIMDDIYTFQGYYSFFLLYCLFFPLYFTSHSYLFSCYCLFIYYFQRLARMFKDGWLGWLGWRSCLLALGVLSWYLSITSFLIRKSFASPLSFVPFL